MANSLKIWAGRSTAPCNVHHRVIGWVVGGMMDEIWARYQQVPPINLLVVNQVTDVPGYNAGYYADTWRLLQNSAGEGDFCGIRRQKRAPRRDGRRPYPV